MRPEFERYDLIERYLKGELSGNEYADVENALRNDSLFRAEVKHHQTIHDLIIDQGLLALKAKMKAYDTQAGGSSLVNILSIGVLILSIIAIGFFTMNSTYLFNENTVKNIQPVKPANDTLTKEERVIVTAPSEIPTVSPAIANRPAPTTSVARTNADSISAMHNPYLSQRIIVPLQTTTFENVPSVSDTVPEPPYVEPEHIHCHLEKSRMTFRVSNSCTSSPTGILSIDKASVFDGKLPMEFSLDGTNYFRAYNFESLYPGIYNLSIRDAQGCAWQDAAEIVIGERDCEEQEYSFSPSMGEVWKFPATLSSGKIEIYNRQGMLVYTSAILNGFPDRWDGTFEGHLLPMGSYSFVFRGNEVITGYVTLLR
jgi:hypothetical protein